KGDRVTWRNVDKVDHQVVADDGAFASPILRPNQSWTSTLGTAGTFRYHDALRPKLTAKVTVKGPPPSVALSLSAPIVYWGTPVTLSGTISSGAVNQRVQLRAHAEPVHDLHREVGERHERQRRRPGGAEDAAPRRRRRLHEGRRLV